MRSIVLAIVLSPLLAAAQRDEWVIAFEKQIPDSAGIPFNLPEEPAHLDAIANYNVVGRVRVINTMEEYKKAFPRYVYTKDSLEKYKHDDWFYRWAKKHSVDSLPVIDFTKDELVIYSGCGQCMAYCDYEESHRSCHRNACMSMYRSFLRKKKHEPWLATGDKRIFLDALYGFPPAGTVELHNLSRNSKRSIQDFLGNLDRSSYLININDSLYRKIYSWELKNYPAYVPVIDFTRKELWLRLVCHQCLIHCNTDHTGWDNRPCHKGVCTYDQKWFVKDRS